MIITPGYPDTLKTKNYTLTDSTTNTVLINKNQFFSNSYEQPIVDGFKLSLNSEASVQLDNTTSGWNSKNLPPFVFEKFVAPGKSGELRPNDYKVFFGNVGIDTSLSFTYFGVPFPSEPVNFRVYDNSSKQFIKFGFLDIDKSDGTGKLSAKGTKKDRIVILGKKHSRFAGNNLVVLFKGRA